MIVETNYRLWADYTCEKEPEKIKAEILHRAQYEHTKELQNYITPGKKSPVLRVQTMEEEWQKERDVHYRIKKNGGHISKEFANSIYGTWGDSRGDTYLTLRTWISYAYPLHCPVEGDILDIDFRALFADARTDLDYASAYPQMFFRPDYFRLISREYTSPIKFWRRIS